MSRHHVFSQRLLQDWVWSVALSVSRHMGLLRTTPAEAAEKTALAAKAGVREDLAAAYRLCHKMGLNEGVCNHLTALLPGSTDRFLVNRYGLLWSEVTADNLVLVDASGEIIEGEGPVEATAFQIHRAIHLADPEKYACVLHTHMPYATALCCIASTPGESSHLAHPDWPLVMCHQNSARFHGDVAFDACFNGLVTDSAEGERLAAAMQGKRVMLHKNHGVIVCGRTVAEAFDDLYYLEKAAQIQLLAMSTGRPLELLRDGVAAGTKAVFDNEKASAARLHLDAWKRQIARDDALAIS